MKVPLLDLKPQYKSLEVEIRAAIDRVVGSQQFIMGPELTGLENEIAAFVGCKHAIGVSSGTDAILCALMAAGVGPGDEVIVPTFTFFATAGCVTRIGAKPVFADIEPDTYNIDPKQLAPLVTSRTKAIIPVHLFGQCAEMEPILELAARHKLVVIEDAAQALSARHRGKRAGVLGHIACFSFFPSKNLGGFGDGGMITTDDDALAEMCVMLRNHGMKPKYYHKFVGGNFRLDALQAAVLRVKLPRLDEWSAARRRNGAAYDRLLAGTGAVRPTVRPHNEMIYNQYVIRHPKRDALRDHLQARDVGTEIYYPIPLHLQECFAPLGGRPGQCPVAEQAAKEVLALPIFPELRPEQLEYVAECIREFECT